MFEKFKKPSNPAFTVTLFSDVGVKAFVEEAGEEKTLEAGPTPTTTSWTEEESFFALT
ncbi:hypothetical protein [Rubinisphaera sp.]|uniref:hypothetical protein n=1 Tax=Rubinisphaera sp. TaxID=2024857 RepID=UPI0025CBD822|nr:hypothetical protein [Rubinisphaera sp.]